MKLYEYIVTYNNSTEVYKDYRYYKDLKEAKKEIGYFGMDLVRLREIKEGEYIDSDIRANAKEELIKRVTYFIKE